MSHSVKIVLDSLAPSGARLTTFELSFPRIVLAEFNTHRLFSRNSASSRAIPVEKMLKRVKEDPFVPRYWGKNQKGMQAEEEFTGDKAHLLDKKWISFSMQASAQAKELMDAGVHKQITNRLLEPFLWHTVIVTATEFRNYFGLRDNKDAAPEIRDSAHDAHGQYLKHEPTPLKHGEWHLPYVDGVDKEELISLGFSEPDLCDISVARCARVSYLTHDGVRDPRIDLELAKNRLAASGHMSPFEHPAMALSFSAWEEVAMKMAMDWIHNRIPVGNFWGWSQYRKSLPKEHCPKDPVYVE